MFPTTEAQTVRHLDEATRTDPAVADLAAVMEDATVAVLDRLVGPFMAQFTIPGSDDDDADDMAG